MNKLQLLMLGTMAAQLAADKGGAGAGGGSKKPPAKKPGDNGAEEGDDEEGEEPDDDEEGGDDEESEEEEESAEEPDDDDEAAAEIERERKKRRKIERELEELRARLAEGGDEEEEGGKKRPAAKQSAEAREAARLRAELDALRAEKAREKARGSVATELSKLAPNIPASLSAILVAGLLSLVEVDKDGDVALFEVRRHIKDLKKASPGVFSSSSKRTASLDTSKGKGGEEQDKKPGDKKPKDDRERGRQARQDTTTRKRV